MSQDREFQQAPGSVAFLLPNLAMGGAERVTLDLACGLAARGARVDLVLMQRTGEFLDQVPHAIRIVELGTTRLRSSIGPLRRYLKQSRPDALVAAMWPLTTIAVMAAAGLNPRPRTVLVDHAPLLSQYAESPVSTLMLRASVRASYRFADRIVAVCDGLAQEMAQLARIQRGRALTIYNPIPKPACSNPPAALWPERPLKRIVTAGRLKPVKDYPHLVEAFAPLANEGEGAVLAILGEGADRAAIEAAAMRLGVADRVLLPGFTPNLGDWLQGADLLVSASQYEGFGNILVEGMHFGLPVVSTDCPHAPREVLGGGTWGTLVPLGDTKALTAAMRSALAAPLDPAGQLARAQEFSAERAVDAYWRMLFE